MELESVIWIVTSRRGTYGVVRMARPVFAGLLEGDGELAARVNITRAVGVLRSEAVVLVWLKKNMGVNIDGQSSGVCGGIVNAIDSRCLQGVVPAMTTNTAMQRTDVELLTCGSPDAVPFKLVATSTSVPSHSALLVPFMFGDQKV